MQSSAMSDNAAHGATTSGSTTTAAEWSAGRGEKWVAQLEGMEATLAPIDEPLIRALRLDAPSTVADVGSGGGGTSLAILRRAPPGSVVHGFDISPALVDIARKRIPEGERNITFERADMATTSPPRAYDRVVSRFGVMFFDDPQAAFTNIARWLAPRGRFAFAVWGPPAENAWLTNVRDVVAEFVEIPPPPPDSPGPFRYGSVDMLLRILEKAGLGNLEVEEWRGSIGIGGALSAVDAAPFALKAFSSFGELLAKGGPTAFDDARRSLTARLSPFEVDGAVRLGACVRIVTGTRPG